MKKVILYFFMYLALASLVGCMDKDTIEEASSFTEDPMKQLLSDKVMQEGGK